MWEREKRWLESIIGEIDELSTSLNQLMDEFGARFEPELEDGEELTVRLDILDETLGRLKTGLTTYIQQEDVYNNQR